MLGGGWQSPWFAAAVSLSCVWCTNGSWCTPVRSASDSGFKPRNLVQCLQQTLLDAAHTRGLPASSSATTASCYQRTIMKQMGVCLDQQL